MRLAILFIGAAFISTGFSQDQPPGSYYEAVIPIGSNSTVDLTNTTSKPICLYIFGSQDDISNVTARPGSTVAEDPGMLTACTSTMESNKPYTLDALVQAMRDGTDLRSSVVSIKLVATTPDSSGNCVGPHFLTMGALTTGLRASIGGVPLSSPTLSSCVHAPFMPAGTCGSAISVLSWAAESHFANGPICRGAQLVTTQTYELVWRLFFH